ncbi:hypothetical protein QJS10_CPB18g00813 [Acorus calamus]|uniref:Uncharacterized protein n=1 Tax=Acorus calamus TaxID=4465 RepID=A0AAV9CKR4_ACOCL|nr:hypothetical protein QJS10_CPB18g00813 [Acorus calamus]
MARSLKTHVNKKISTALGGLSSSPPPLSPPLVTRGDSTLREKGFNVDPSSPVWTVHDLPPPPLPPTATADAQEKRKNVDHA